MARRLGYTLEALQRMHPAACASDARLVWKDGDGWNMGIVVSANNGTEQQFIQGLSVCGPRELRLLGLQMIARADELESFGDPHEVVE